MQTFTLRVYRLDPETDSAPVWEEFTVPKIPQMMVLDALFQVQTEQDDSLAFRFSCRVGMCGSCGMVINWKPRLACRTPVEGLGEVIEVMPMRNMPVVKDLVVDMDPFFEKYEKILPYLVPRDPNAGPAQIPPGSPERGIIDENLECITCGLCYSGCGVVAADPTYLGPAALNRAYALIQDSRDSLTAERMQIVDSHQGVWRCKTQLACTDHCPKHLSPTATIQKLKGRALRRRVRRVLPWLSEDE